MTSGRSLCLVTITVLDPPPSNTLSCMFVLTCRNTKNETATNQSTKKHWSSPLRSSPAISWLPQRRWALTCLFLMEEQIESVSICLSFWECDFCIVLLNFRGSVLHALYILILDVFDIHYLLQCTYILVTFFLLECWYSQCQISLYTQCMTTCL